MHKWRVAQAPSVDPSDDGVSVPATAAADQPPPDLAADAATDRFVPYYTMFRPMAAAAEAEADADGDRDGDEVGDEAAAEPEGGDADGQEPTSEDSAPLSEANPSGTDLSEAATELAKDDDSTDDADGPEAPPRS